MITLHPDVPLAHLSTLGLGGRARFLCEISEAGDLDEVMELGEAKQLPIHILGGGSNLIVSDEGVEALVLRPLLRHWGWEHGGDGVLVTAGAGLELDELVAESTRRGLWGLENLSGIPGKMGAAPVQNVGAYGVEISELIENVEVYDFQHRCLRRLDPAACEFSYRNSIFRRNPGSFLITGICLRLSEKAAPRLEYADLRAFDWPEEANPELVRNRVLDIRREKGMLIEKSPAPPIGSAGSFFVNPILEAAEFDGIRTRTHTEIPTRKLPDGRIKAAAARLIEASGFPKGFRRGAFGISPHHALALIHYGGGRSSDLLMLAGDIQAAVEERFGIHLEPEPIFWGFNTSNPLKKAGRSRA